MMSILVASFNTCIAFTLCYYLLSNNCVNDTPHTRFCIVKIIYFFLYFAQPCLSIRLVLYSKVKVCCDPCRNYGQWLRYVFDLHYATTIPSFDLYFFLENFVSIASVRKLILLALRLCVIVICFIGDRFI